MLRILTSGESHGPALCAIIDGLPAGMPVDLNGINHLLALRQRGHGRGKRQQIEHDAAEPISGVRLGQSLPGPITLLVRNRDYAAWQGRMQPEPAAERPTPITSPRPGHADFAGVLKHDLSDIRDILERSSARNTASLVAAGALCLQLISAIGIRVHSYVRAIGPVEADPPDASELARLAAAIEESPVRCPDTERSRAMVVAIDRATEEGDTLGGIFDVVAIGCPPGLGSCTQWDRRLDSRLAAAIMGIQAVKGVEIGAGFRGAGRPGSEVHDEFEISDEHGFLRTGNNAGGIEGGMSNGEPILVSGAMKPIPTLRKRLASVNLFSREVVPAHYERSDVCAVPAASVVGMAMVGIVLADAAIERFGADSYGAFLRSAAAWREALAERGYTGARWSPA